MHDRPKLVDGQEKGLQVALKTHHWTYSPDTNLQYRDAYDQASTALSNCIQES
jgi:hypothetical protein